MIRRVCLVAREMEGVVGAGGLKDVVRGLANALVRRGAQTICYLPRYGSLSVPSSPMKSLSLRSGERLGVHDVSLEGIELRLIEHRCFAEKNDVYVYREGDAPHPRLIGCGHQDALAMNALFQEAVIRDLFQRGEHVDVIHGHDGHCGLLPLYMERYPSFFHATGFLLTIHNAGVVYQQCMGSLEEAVAITGLPSPRLALGLMDSMVSPLLIAARTGSINTVSPGYAQEVLQKKDSSSGSFGGLLQQNRIPLPGVLNGLDTDFWLTTTDAPGLQKSQERIRVRQSLEYSIPGLQRYGDLPSVHHPWVLFHGRLTEQKGVDEILLLHDDHPAGDHPVHVLVYGQGEAEYEAQLMEKCQSGGPWTFFKGYAPDFAQDLLAASSFVLLPSLWEPCGQVDMAGQLLGALPIVRGVGGLKKIRHQRDGYSYSSEGPEGLEFWLKKALNDEELHPKRLARMRKRAENTIYERRNWNKVLVRGYFPLYRRARRQTLFRRSPSMHG